MLINKITTGFVIRVFDTDTGKYVSQNFTAGEVEYEEQDGTPTDDSKNETYLPFDMVQPNENAGCDICGVNDRLEGKTHCKDCAKCIAKIARLDF